MSEKLLKSLKASIFLAVLLLNTACAAEVVAEVTETPAPTKLAIITATLPQINTPIPTSTPLPTTTAKPFEPVEGQTTSEVNVRTSASAASQQMGTIEIFATLQVFGKDPAGKWWMIAFPEGSDGRGWVAAEFVQVADSAAVPVINVEPENPPVVEEPQASPEPGATTSVVVPTLVAPTSVLAVAADDGDSVENPAVNVVLSPVLLTSLGHASDISSPQGDAEDWIRFAFDGEFGAEKQVTVLIECSGSGKLGVDLTQNGVVWQTWDDIRCDKRTQLQLTLFVGAPYALRFFPVQGDLSATYISYKMRVDLMK